MLGEPAGGVGAQEAERNAGCAGPAQRHQPVRDLLEARRVGLTQRLDVVAGARSASSRKAS